MSGPKIKVGGDLTDAVKAFRDFRSTAEGEVDKLRRGVSRSFDRIEGDAKRSAAGSERAWSRALDGAGKAGKAFGGRLGGAVTILEDFGSGLGQASGALGVLGTAAAGAGLAVAGVGFTIGVGANALLDFARSAVDAADRIHEMGLESEAADNITGGLAESMTAFGAATDLAMVEVADGVPELRKFVQTLTGGLVILSEWGAELQGVIDTAKFVGDTFSFGVGAKIRGAFDVAAKRGALLEEKLEDVGETADDVAKPAEEIGRLRDANREAAAAARELEQAQRRWVTDTATAIGIMNSALEDQASAEDKVAMKYIALRQQVQGLEADEDARAAALQALNDREQRDLQGLRAAKAQAHLEAVGHLREQEEAAADFARAADEASTMAEAAMVQAAENSGIAWGALAQQMADTASQIGSIATGVLSSFEQLNSMRIADLQEQAREEVDAALKANDQWEQTQLAKIERDQEAGRISDQQAAMELRNIAQQKREKDKVARSLARDERRAARKTFRANQQLQRAQAIMAAAQNAIALTPAFAFLGPGAPIAAATAAAVALAPQLAIINRQDPPEFPMGLAPTGGHSPDHTMLAAIQPHEGVATRQAIDSIGGPQALEDLNRGAGMAREVRVYVQMGRTTLAEAVAMVGANGVASASADSRLGKSDHSRS